MATRRFITKDLLMTDAYYELRAQEKVLLIYLIVFADDDGFNDKVKSYLKLSRTTVKTLNTLQEKGFIINLRDNLVVVKNWYQMNKMAPSKYVKTKYQKEKIRLELDELGIYHNPYPPFIF